MLVPLQYPPAKLSRSTLIWLPLSARCLLTERTEAKEVLQDQFSKLTAEKESMQGQLAGVTAEEDLQGQLEDGAAIR